jgi:hypothetical protein
VTADVHSLPSSIADSPGIHLAHIAHPDDAHHGVTHLMVNLVSSAGSVRRVSPMARDDGVQLQLAQATGITAADGTRRKGSSHDEEEMVKCGVLW